MKNGGPYTKKQRDSRRNEVFRLHLEQGKSAVAISKILGVSRNTVNEDIQFWYDQLDEDYLGYDYNSWVAKQLQRLESQRSRLLDQLEKEKDAKKILIIEDRLYRLDVKLLELTEKLLHNKRKIDITIEDIDEELVKRIIRFILLEHPSTKSITHFKDEIEKCVIVLLRCTARKSSMVIFKMQELGLQLYKVRRQIDVLDVGDEYYLWDFAKARGYINQREYDKKQEL